MNKVTSMRNENEVTYEIGDLNHGEYQKVNRKKVEGILSIVAYYEDSVTPEVVENSRVILTCAVPEWRRLSRNTDIS
ncbi:hypothetical protein [Paenibacillus sp. L3-i20]|uniref:hypothetical protein n=1 Tax=Paenibacillus sp. L3-i20 TaxID=2905833 RepID=UPI00207EB194|nr:hypothetical protein [Paenibacillus sp. L3-i20]GKU80508.1 hypothetical protein L3i20_v249050 [Paenibacillus sp. L3-i20]